MSAVVIKQSHTRKYLNKITLIHHANKQRNSEDMMDVKFNFYSDTPPGKDPDSFSSTLRKYHQKLWSKKLPNGKKFTLDLDTPKLLHHSSEIEEFYLSSDAITHTYKGVKKMSHIFQQLQKQEHDDFFDLCSTIGAYIIFPSKRIDGKMTINGARGTNRSIQDRFDLTLECIKRFYSGIESPLYETFIRYKSFFELFEDFRGYIDFFLLNDMVSKDYKEIVFWLPFNSFDYSPLPQTLTEYYSYKENVERFVKSRNARICKLHGETN